MINVQDNSACCGCSACASACPAGCISMVADAEGFPYPQVDGDSCVGCGRCEGVCPLLGMPEGAPVLASYAARTRDRELLHASSSGGVFTELCRPVLAAGGAVYGVVMGEGCRGCSFARADDMAGVTPIRGSKYLQADSRGVYERVATDLAAGREVLFSGTPCQANALSWYLAPDRGGLLLVDFICHGMPSPRLWAESVETLEARMGSKVTSVDFRCKEASWQRFGLRMKYGDSVLFQPLDESPYLRMFLRDLCLRESCYACKAKGSRAADVTIADFWGVEKVAPEMAGELGCSLVIVRTPKGAEAIGQIRGALEVREVPYDDAVRGNRSVAESVARPPERDVFFGDLDAMGYEGVARKYGMPSAKERMKRLVKGALGKVGLLEAARKLRGGGCIKAPEEDARSLPGMEHLVLAGTPGAHPELACSARRPFVRGVPVPHRNASCGCKGALGAARQRLRVGLPDLVPDSVCVSAACLGLSAGTAEARASRHRFCLMQVSQNSYPELFAYDTSETDMMLRSADEAILAGGRHSAGRQVLRLRLRIRASIFHKGRP